MGTITKVICAFCGGSLLDAFHREGRTYGRCSQCRAFLRTDTRAIEGDFYQDNDFAHRIESTIGTEPDFAGFDQWSPLFRDGNILEIGCGTGHFLAAAKARGRTVCGTEQSPHHRAYVKRRWGIDVSDTLPAGVFDNVLSCNVFEHIADPYAHLVEIRRTLKPGGRFIISTANADCLIAKVCGPWWAMFKPADHFSIPSAVSLRIVGERANLRIGRIWCSEYPLETPVGFALALHDRFRRETVNGRSAPERPTSSATSRVQRIRELRAFRFVGDALAGLMVAGSIKAIFEKQ